MSGSNGHAHENGTSTFVAPPAVLGMPAVPQLSAEKVKDLVAALETPFDARVIEWRVMNTTKNQQPVRGQVVPYADHELTPIVSTHCLLRQGGRAGTRFTRARISSGVRTRRLSRRCLSPAN